MAWVRCTVKQVQHSTFRVSRLTCHTRFKLLDGDWLRADKSVMSRSKIGFPPDKDVALVYLNWSKTNQFGNREVVIPMVADPVRALDPVFHLKKLFSSFNLPDHMPAFSYVKKGRILCVTYAKFTKDLRNLLDMAGFRAKSYSGHSFRRGGATYLYSRAD